VHRDHHPGRLEDRDVSAEKNRGAPKRQVKKPKAAAKAKAAEKTAARNAANSNKG
jgi:hypothetical protein